jgi:acyl-CoA synthetase (AMP-forming)/AMP-acid ligase II
MTATTSTDTVAEDTCVNVARRLTEAASSAPDQVAVAAPLGRDADGTRQYATVTFGQLDEDSNRLASALRSLGVQPGMRLALLVPPSIDFFALVFGLLKSGAVTILIDPGMGRKNLLRCLQDAEPEGFVAISPVQAVRTLLRRRFPKARLNVTVGRRWFWRGATIDELRKRGDASAPIAPTRADDPAAIIFTTGSTGPPKGVLYRHETFDQQAAQIRAAYDIQPGEIDLPGFPLFGLFNAAMGVTTVIPDMDPTRPADVDPELFVEAIDQWQATQAFGSPALWNRVGSYCRENNVRMSSLRRVLSAGAPVPPRVLRDMTQSIHEDGEMHTPYGATEALPVASISASEVLDETAALSEQGRGTCVGRRFPGIRWQVIRPVDGPIAGIAGVEPTPLGEIGELIVSGPVVSRQYVTRVEANSLAKINGDGTVWHRMGDVGYLDEQERFWFCGRMAHRVLTAERPMYSVCCEAIFNQHENVFRTALVGVGLAGSQRPVIVVEPVSGKMPSEQVQRDRFVEQLRVLAAEHAITANIDQFLFHPALPVDIRHNAKIFREQLAVWAAEQL